MITPAPGELLRDRRASHRDFFDLYFRFELPGDALTKQEVDELLQNANSTDAFARSVRNSLDTGRFGALLRNLAVYRIEAPFARKNVAQALVDISDEVEVQLGLPMDEYELPQALSAAVSRQIMSGGQDWADFTLQLVTDARGLSEVVRIADHEFNRETNPVGIRYQYLPDARLPELRALIVQKFQQLQETALPKLGNHVQFHLHRWAQWGGKSDVESWIRRRLTTRTGFLDLVGYFSKSHVGLTLFEAENLSRLVSWNAVLRARRGLFKESREQAIGLLKRFDTGVYLFRKRRKEERRSAAEECKRQTASNS
jgi:hypothetical protein